ncbi:MAG: transketolase, partial [Oscillospiraceae bacterium]|nr:transketolase [Oscillospiraceae bacterium]
PLADKWRSLGWCVYEVNGHDVVQIAEALDKADDETQRPVALIANTVKGKGVSFAENVAGFHNGALTPEQYQTATTELNAVIDELKLEIGI